MGVINQGILGAVSGKIGNVIGASWKGIPYLRIKPASVANPNTFAQRDQRSKFSLTLKFLQPINEFLKIGFKDYAVKMSAFNAALAYNIQNSIAGTFPDHAIDYPNTLLSRGALKNVADASASSPESGIIDFTWTDNSGDGNALATDRSMYVIYDPIKNEAYTSKSGPARSSGSVGVVVPNSFSGNSVHTWIAFISEDGQLVSNSQYTGEVTVA